MNQDRLNMLSWSCGTTVCAAGAAMNDQWFNSHGFLNYFGCPRYCNPSDEFHGWDAIRKFFDVARQPAEYVFSSHRYRYLGRPPTPQDVINHIDQVLNGTFQ